MGKDRLATGREVLVLNHLWRRAAVPVATLTALVYVVSAGVKF